tara:strand:+ start:2209 stop:2910 length:702 start_codon:yes stop_codon:yes gene_type:complete
MILLNMTQNNIVYTEETLTIFELITSTGTAGIIIICILFILSAISLYVFLERYLSIKKIDKNDQSFIQKINELIKENKLKDAEDLCENTDNVISRLINKGLKRTHRPLIEIESMIEGQASIEISKIESNLAYLATISGAAPMIGFLGTVIGMILAFHEMANAGGSNVDIQLLSTGIYTAMITTVAGLIVGIGSYIGYNVLVSKVAKIVLDIETQTIGFIENIIDKRNESKKKK